MNQLKQVNQYIYLSKQKIVLWVAFCGNPSFKKREGKIK